MKSPTVFNMILLLLLANTAASVEPDIVSIDGSLTEIIYELGDADRLLAVDSTSLYPDRVKQLPQVGYMRQLSAEGILSLRPKLVIASMDSGPDRVFEQLNDAGVEVVRIESENSLEGVLHKVRKVAQALDKPLEGEALALQIKERTEQAVSEIPEAVPVKSLFLMGNASHGMMAAGQKTKANDLLGILQVENSMHYQGYKPLGSEGATLAAPDVVLVAYTGEANTQALIGSLSMTPAGQNNKVYFVDIALTLGFGPRLPEAIKQLVPLVYNEIEE